MDSSTPSAKSLLARLSVPANRTRTLSFCDASQDGIDVFLADLPVANSPEVLNRLYRAVPEVAALEGDCGLRLTLLQRLQPVIFHHVEQLTDRLTVTDKTARQLSLAMALLKNLALGYKSVVADLVSTGSDDRQQLAAALQLAIKALSRMMTTSWQCFVNPPANLWREIHTLFLLAGAQNVEKLTPFSAQDHADPGQAPRTAYLRILLVAAADPARLSPRDLKQLLNFLDTYAHHAELVSPCENPLFIIDPNRDRGPILSTRMRASSPSFIGLDSNRLATFIDRYLAPSEIQLSPRLLAQVRRYWSTAILRREEHREQREQIQVVFGLSRLHRLITETANIDAFVSHCQVNALRAGQRLLSIEDTRPQNMWHDTRESDPSVNWLQPAHRNPEDPIAYTPLAAQKSGDHPTIFEATQVNISEHGACIEIGTAPDNLTPGELVAIRADSSARWRMGLVRWTRTTAAFSRLAGMEFFDLTTYPCAVALIRNNQRTSAFFPAFLARPGNGEENLLVPSLPFTEGSQVLLIEARQRGGARLTEIIEATHQLTLFHIEREPLP